MRFLGFGGNDKPHHLDFMPDRDYDRLVGMVESELNTRKIAFQTNRKNAAILFPRTRSTMGLTNLAQMCHQAPEHEWKAMVEHFVAGSERLWSQDPRANQDASFDEVRTKLKVRLNTLEMATSQVLPLLALIPVSDRFLTYLAIDNPDEVSTVTEETVAKWGKSKEELLALALENVRAQDEVQKTPAQVSGNVCLDVYLGDSFFASSHFLMLDRLYPSCPEHGFIASVPNRHTVLAYPLVDSSAVEALPHMALLTHNFYKKGPGSISWELFWWRKGVVMPLAVDIGSGGARLHGPDDFIALLSNL